MKSPQKKEKEHSKPHFSYHFPILNLKSQHLSLPWILWTGFPRPHRPDQAAFHSLWRVVAVPEPGREKRCLDALTGILWEISCFSGHGSLNVPIFNKYKNGMYFRYYGMFGHIFWGYSLHWIGLRENFNRKPMGFDHQIGWAFRFQFSHNPILWFSGCLWIWSCFFEWLIIWNNLE